MVGHDHVGEEQEPSRLAGFVERLAGDNLDGVGLKNGQPIFGHDCDVEGLGVSGDLELGRHIP